MRTAFHRLSPLGSSSLVRGKGELLLAGPRPPVARPPARDTPSSGLDERVVMLIVGLAVVACVALSTTSAGLFSSAAHEPRRIATLLALTLALQMFSVRVYGRG